MWNNIKNFVKELEWWFFWFWVKNYKMSFLVLFAILIYWSYSLYVIPKESSPEIEFWIVQISTIYQWANPVDVDELITSEIEDEIEDLEWIKKITSVSRLWLSNITIEYENWVDMSDAIVDIKDKLDNINFPTDVEDPVVTELETSVNEIFRVVLYWPDNNFSKDYLLQSAKYLQNNLEWKWLIDKIKIEWWTDFDLLVLLEKDKLDALWLGINNIVNIIRSYNRNYPLWNFRIWDLNYDYRIQWELESLLQLYQIPIKNAWSSLIRLEEISKIVRDYNNDNITRVWFYWKKWFNAVSFSVEKVDWADVFAASKSAKELLNETLKLERFKGMNMETYYDISDVIIKDYKDLARSWLLTIILVFSVLLLFIWLKEAIIASIAIPLSFLVTFWVLNNLWLTLNFLTNFSFVLALWIAIDTTIVIVEWAHTKIRIWYNPKHAILLAIRDYKRPLIAWTATTLAAFLPMLSLPWVLWKFLAYIPITVFSVLVAALFFSMSTNSALFYKLTKSRKNYQETKDDLLDIDKELLEIDREWKEPLNSSKNSIRRKFLDTLWSIYYNILWFLVWSRLFRILSIFVPIILIIVSLLFLSPRIWFTLFPWWWNPFLQWKIDWKNGLDKEVMVKYLSWVDNILSEIPEIKLYKVTLNNNSISLFIELYENEKRWIISNIWKLVWLGNDIEDQSKYRESFEVENLINEKFEYFNSFWLNAQISVLRDWPPTWSQVWIKLVADSNSKFKELIAVSNDFEDYLLWLDSTKNVTNSSSDTPWQFVFEYKKDYIRELWLTPNDITNELVSSINWVNAWTISMEFDDRDIKLKYSKFEEFVSPHDIMNMFINTSVWQIKLWDVMEYNVDNSIDSIQKENWRVLINVWADIKEKFVPSDIQGKLIWFAEEYNYPWWIWFEIWWENQENAEIIQATVVSFVIAILLIFTILVLQFKSYWQPAIILYSVLLALLWVNIWLYLTWNPYSMTFGIWFIALTWIVVNNAIILIDSINKNLENWADWKKAVKDAWRSRLQPMLVTTLTTTFWMLPLALQDPFWAWLAYTVIFWLATWTLMTLFVIPSLYYELFIDRPRVYWLLTKLFVVIICVWLIYYLLVNLLSFNALLSSIISVIVLVLFFVYIIYNTYFKKKSE